MPLRPFRGSRKNSMRIPATNEIVVDQFGYFDASPNLTYTPEAVVADGDTIAAWWTATGTHEGGFQGLEPTGEDIEILVTGTFQIEDEHSLRCGSYRINSTLCSNSASLNRLASNPIFS